RALDVEDRREVARELDEQRLALRRRHGERRARQSVLDALALGDVRRDRADPVRQTAAVDERKLGRQIRPLLAVELERLLELDRAPLEQHPQVVVPQARGELRREELAVGAADELRRGAAEQPLELAVHEQVTALRVLREHRGRRVVDHLVQPRFAFAQRLYRGVVGGPIDRQIRRAHGACQCLLRRRLYRHGQAASARLLHDGRSAVTKEKQTGGRRRYFARGTNM